MEGNFQTSFIPKKPILDGTTRPRGTNVVSLITGIIFILVLLLAGGVVGYKYYLSHSIETTQTALDTELQKFSEQKIVEFTKLDNRIETARMLIDQHVALSNFFEFLGNITLKSVRFSSFSYAAKDSTHLAVTMSGQAQNFSSVACQAIIFANQPGQVGNPNFSNFNLDAKSNVVFAFIGNINPRSFTYRASLSSSTEDMVKTNCATATSSLSARTITNQ
jgi:hypothetical protein